MTDSQLVSFTVKYMSYLVEYEEEFDSIDECLRFAWGGYEWETSCCHEIWCNGEILMNREQTEAEHNRRDAEFRGYRLGDPSTYPWKQSEVCTN